MASSARRNKSRSTRSRRLLLECLEERRVMATYSSYPHEYTVVNDQAFLVANDGRGYALWRTDGTASGTALIIDSGASNPYDSQRHFNDLTNVSGTLFFARGDLTGNAVLWKSDGSAAGTQQLGNATNAIYFANVNGTLFFTAADPVHGQELWKSDGTVAGTQLVKDLAPGVTNSNPRRLTNSNGELFFVEYNANDEQELWKSDGTEEGTLLVKNFGVSYRPGSSALSLTDTKGTLFVVTDNAAGNFNLWISDGTDAGTTLLSQFAFSGTDPHIPLDMTDINGTTFFGVQSQVSELWKTDGTAGGTVKVRDLRDGSRGFPRIGTLVDLNGELLVSASDTRYASALFKSDGTFEGTVIVHSFPGGPTPYLTNLDGTLYFATATHDKFSTGLWASDGTLNGTHVVKDFGWRATGDLDSDIAGGKDGIVRVGETILFTADLGRTGFEPWISSGADAGTKLLKDINSVNGTEVVQQIGASPTYRENAPPVALVKPSAYVYDPSSTSFGRLSVTYRNPHGAGDRLNIRNDGVGPGQIGVSGDKVTYEGKVIGQRFGFGPESLTVRFVPNVSDGVVGAVLRAITYENINRTTMESGYRDLKIELSSTDRFYRRVLLESVDNPPVLEGRGAPTYQMNESPPAARLLYGVNVIDHDSTNFTGGELAIRFTLGASTTDFLTLSGSYKFDSHDNLYRGDQIMGTRLPGGGSHGNDLIISLNEHANAIGIANFLADLRFSTRTPGQRELSYTLTDGDGGTSNTITSTVTVPENVAPVLTGGGAVGAPQAEQPTAMFSGATVSDADSPNFYGGRLLLSFDTHPSSDQIILAGPFVLDANNYLILNRPVDGPLVIGRLTSGDLSSQELEFTLSAQATAARVQWLLNSIRFSGDDTSTPRQLSATLTDGDGGTSNTIVATIEVS